MRAIFFDLDGTLRNNLPSGGEVFAEYAARLGLPTPADARRRAARWEHFYWANSPHLQADRQAYPQEHDFWVQYSRRRLISLGASPSQAGELAPLITQYMLESYRPASIVPQDGMRLLPLLQQSGYTLAVISNRETSYQSELEALGLRPYFAFSLAAGEVRAWKPQAEIFLHACRQAQVTPAEAVYIGDNYFADVIGSQRAGLQPILYDPQRLFPEAECPVILSFDELPSILENL